MVAHGVGREYARAAHAAHTAHTASSRSPLQIRSLVVGVQRSLNGERVHSVQYKLQRRTWIGSSRTSACLCRAHHRYPISSRLLYTQRLYIPSYTLVTAPDAMISSTRALSSTDYPDLTLVPPPVRHHTEVRTVACRCRLSRMSVTCVPKHISMLHREELIIGQEVACTWLLFPASSCGAVLHWVRARHATKCALQGVES